MRSDGCETLSVTTVIPTGSERMKSAETSDFIFLRFLLKLMTWVAEFFINLTMLSLLIGMMICLCDGPLVVILIWCLGLRFPLTISLIWPIFFTPMDGNISLILITSDVLVLSLDTWVYILLFLGVCISSCLFLKYLEMTLTSFWDLAGIRGGILLVLAGVDFAFSLEGLWGAKWILGVNLAAIFLLRVLDLLLVKSAS